MVQTEVRLQRAGATPAAPAAPAAPRKAHRMPLSSGSLSPLWCPALAALLLTLGLTGCDGQGGQHAWTGAEAGEGEDSQKKAVPPPLVEVATPRLGTIRDTITLNGDLRAEHTIEITSRVAEVVKSVFVREGQRVAKGEKILELDDQQLRLLAAQEVLAHKDALQRAASAELDLAEAVENESLQSKLRERAEKEYQRFQRILDSGGARAVSLEEIETKQYAFEEAKTAHEKSKLALRRARVDEELAAIAAERADLARQRAQLDVDHCKITSPIDGFISYLEVLPGELVETATRVVEVVNTDHLYTEVRVPQRKLPALSVGQAVELHSEVDPERTFAGRLDVIHPTVDAQEGTVKVRIALQRADERLRPGVYVTATIVTALYDSALLIPKRARLFDRDRSVVFVVDADKIAHRVEISVGLQTVEELQVKRSDDVGLRHTDRLVVRGQTSLKDGMRVRILGEDDEPETSPADSGVPADTATQKVPGAREEARKGKG